MQYFSRFLGLIFCFVFLFGCGVKDGGHRFVMGVDQGSGSRVVLLDVDVDWVDGGIGEWSWGAGDSDVILVGDKGWFGSMTDVKPWLVGGEKCMMVSASGGGVAVVRLRDKAVLFYAYVGGNTHSVAGLPGGYLVAACSTGRRLSLLRMGDFGDGGAKDVKLIDYVFKGAHGVVWDDGADRLWAVGDDAIRRYELKAGGLVMDGEWELPSVGGHDLSVEAKGSGLYITCVGEVWRFDRDIFKFGKVEGLEGVAHVKSLDEVVVGEYLIVRPDVSWWSDRVWFYVEGKVWFKRLAGARFYKARWWADWRVE